MFTSTTVCLYEPAVLIVESVQAASRGWQHIQMRRRSVQAPWSRPRGQADSRISGVAAVAAVNKAIAKRCTGTGKAVGIETILRLVSWSVEEISGIIDADGSARQWLVCVCLLPQLGIP